MPSPSLTAPAAIFARSLWWWALPVLTSWARLDQVDIGDMKVHWLLGVPITEAERQWLEANGFDAFVELLDAKAVNYTDLQRPSVV